MKASSLFGVLPVVKHLLELKANIEAKDNWGMCLDSASVVVFSMCITFACMCWWMLMCGVDVMLFPDNTPLILASENGKLPVVEYLVEHKANIEAKNSWGMFFYSASAVLFSLYAFARMCWWMLACGGVVMLFRGLNMCIRCVCIRCFGRRISYPFENNVNLATVREAIVFR